MNELILLDIIAGRTYDISCLSLEWCLLWCSIILVTSVLWSGIVLVIGVLWGGTILLIAVLWRGSIILLIGVSLVGV